MHSLTSGTVINSTQFCYTRYWMALQRSARQLSTPLRASIQFYFPNSIIKLQRDALRCWSLPVTMQQMKQPMISSFYSWENQVQLCLRASLSLFFSIYYRNIFLTSLSLCILQLIVCSSENSLIFFMVSGSCGSGSSMSRQCLLIWSSWRLNSRLGYSWNRQLYFLRRGTRLEWQRSYQSGRQFMILWAVYS